MMAGEANLMFGRRRCLSISFACLAFAFLALVSCSPPIAYPQGCAGWRDPSKHRVEFVTVEDGVRLEVLDWGGSGRTVVLLAGSGNSAHIFDDFAEKLSSTCCHVYGITRRGFGISSHPDSGYSQQRLSDDVLQVLTSLKIAAPVLIGHSMSGEELTTMGDEHSDRLAGLVYLDAADDPADFPGESAGYMALFEQLPQAMRDRTSPTAVDLKSFRAFHDYKVRTRGYPYPEAELHNTFKCNPDGSVGGETEADRAHDFIGQGALKRDYSHIRVPVLAIFATLGVAPLYQPRNEQELIAIRNFEAATDVYEQRYKKNLRLAKGGVHIVDLPKANHYLFLSNEADVLREMQSFLATLQ
jgi:non-heme chloroperoxidase